MGYKLAGYQVLGGLEIDQKVASVYKINHKPKYMYQEDIRSFLNRSDIPDELFDLDILDGSPPCIPFSMAGIREKGWGVERKYAEGRVYQTLDELFCIFIQLIGKLRPKIAVIENVMGLMVGKAKNKYLPLIGSLLREVGYDYTLIKLDASNMGVPQKRQRMFFICVRKEIEVTRNGLFKNVPKINLSFNQKKIPSRMCLDNLDKEEKDVKNIGSKYWKKCKLGDSFNTVSKTGWYSQTKVNPEKQVPTLVCSSAHGPWHPTICRPLNKQEWINVSTFPQDYDFSDVGYPYIIGNSVPPVMMANIAHEIHKQWLSKL